MDFIHDLKSVVPYGRSRFGRKCQNSEGSLILHFCRHRHREEQKEGGGGNYGVSAWRGGVSWYADETYVKVQGRWCYLYRAIDREGNLLDAMMSETRDLEAAKQFFARTLTIVGKPPQRVTTDGHAAYPHAIRETLGRKVVHRCNPYLNSR
jgi:hypothetical protein